jgi:hypothetical protein
VQVSLSKEALPSRTPPVHVRTKLLASQSALSATEYAVTVAPSAMDPPHGKVQLNPEAVPERTAVPLVAPVAKTDRVDERTPFKVAFGRA